jgi:hypothetical protein
MERFARAHPAAVLRPPEFVDFLLARCGWKHVVDEPCPPDSDGVPDLTVNFVVIDQGSSVSSQQELPPSCATLGHSTKRLSLSLYGVKLVPSPDPQRLDPPSFYHLTTAMRRYMVQFGSTQDFRDAIRGRWQLMPRYIDVLDKTPVNTSLLSYVPDLDPNKMFPNADMPGYVDA